MKILFCHLFFFCSLYQAQAQWQWVNTIPDSGNSTVMSMTVDHLNNVFVTGHYNGFILLDEDTFPATGYQTDIFITKYDAFGNLMWMKTAGGPGGDQGRGIAVDSESNVYVIGSFNDSVSFEGHVMVSAGSEDIFLVKYNSDGQFVWVKKWGAEFTEVGSSLCINEYDDLFMLGWGMTGSPSPPVVSDYATLVLGDDTLVSHGNGDVLIAKLDTAGHIRWSKNCGGKSGDFAYGISSDVHGNVYTTGTVSSITSYFGGDSLINKSAFVAKYDSLGNILWVRGVDNQSFSIYGTGVSTDSEGNVFAIGHSSPEEVPKVFSPGIVVNEFAYLVKYDSLGNLLWAKGIGAPYYTGVRGLVVDGDDNIYFSGYFNYKLYVGGDTVYAYGHDDIFLNKYDNHGTQRWTMNVGGQGFDQGSALCMDNQGDLLLGGYIGSAPTYFGTQEASSLSQRDAFVAKYTPGYASIPDVSPIEPRIILYPNPSSGAVHIRCKGNVFDNLEIRDMQGRTVYRTAIGSDDFFLDLGQLPVGMYALTLYGIENMVVKKIMLQR